MWHRPNSELVNVNLYGTDSSPPTVGRDYKGRVWISCHFEVSICWIDLINGRGKGFVMEILSELGGLIP